MTNPYLCLFMISLLSPLGLLEEDILPSSNTGPEDDWLPGSNPWVFDSASNPILQPPDLLEWILGDPAVVQLGGKIHMFANEVFCGFFLNRVKYLKRCSTVSYTSQPPLTHRPISRSMIRYLVFFGSHISIEISRYQYWNFR